MLSVGTAGMALTGLLAVLAASLYIYMRTVFGYWQRRKVPCPEAPTVPFGNYGDAILGKVTVAQRAEQLYKKYREERFFGTYFGHNPLLQINDPEIIKQVFVKEFPNFNGRGMYCDPDSDPLSGHLFILSGPRWKNLRIKLTPVFTTGKIKYMFDKVKECAADMGGVIQKEIKANRGSATIDMREALARFSTDVISSVAFGIEPNAIKDPDSEFRRIGKKIVEPSVQQSLRMMSSFFLRGIMKFFNASIAGKEVNEFMRRVVYDTVSYREKNNINRPDMMNLLIQLKNKGFVASDSVLNGNGSPDGHTEGPAGELTTLSMDELMAQAFVFFLAGYETTSATTSFALYEMAKYPDVQEKVLREVDEVMKRHDGKITYEAIMDMTYTDKVINETMRLYPAVPFLTREAMKKCKLPLTDVVLDEGTQLVIPVLALHYDPEYFPNPTKFDPERFSEGNKTYPPFSYLPFGDGPRICIGMRFGLVQVKTALLTLLSKYRMELGNMPKNLTINPKSVIPQPVEDICLKVVAR